VSNKLLIGCAVAVLAIAGSACNTTDNANANVNANLAVAETTRAGADNSDIITKTDASGVRTETRVFRNNPRVRRVVVTTQPSGQRTVRVYSVSGEEKVVDNIGDALSETGDAIATAAGWTVDKTGEALNEAGDKLEDVGDQTAKGAKTVGKKTVSGAKKVGSKVKDVVTP
jgi:hypothetical protein